MKIRPLAGLVVVASFAAAVQFSAGEASLNQGSRPSVSLPQIAVLPTGPVVVTVEPTAPAGTSGTRQPSPPAREAQPVPAAPPPAPPRAPAPPPQPVASPVPAAPALPATWPSRRPEVVPVQSPPVVKPPPVVQPVPRPGPPAGEPGPCVRIKVPWLAPRIAVTEENVQIRVHRVTHHRGRLPRVP
ncbi:hypothetical protein [Longispora albida]|uniref:hypothetical protein n=1 Tax=Longispora albida TaxID=203523 RepID=UPI00047779FF|nr:hypothetical protein [Longispora albida]